MTYESESLIQMHRMEAAEIFNQRYGGNGKKLLLTQIEWNERI